jgi:hypothetical protein
LNRRDRGGTICAVINPVLAKEAGIENRKLGGIMLARFIYLKEDSKFFIVASVVCTLIILVVIAMNLGILNHDLKYNDWAQVMLIAR